MWPNIQSGSLDWEILYWSLIHLHFDALAVNLPEKLSPVSWMWLSCWFLPSRKRAWLPANSRQRQKTMDEFTVVSNACVCLCVFVYVCVYDEAKVHLIYELTLASTMLGIMGKFSLTHAWFMGIPLCYYWPLKRTSALAQEPWCSKWFHPSCWNLPTVQP